MRMHSSWPVQGRHATCNVVSRARTICRHAGCHQLVDVSGYCPKHEAMHVQATDAKRGSASSRGYNRKWQKARATYLAREPLCVKCKCEGVMRAATVVDHIIPHKNDQDLFWDTSNWQSLCKPHHDRKTATEDGGFGNAGGTQKSAIFQT